MQARIRNLSWSTFRWFSIASLAVLLTATTLATPAQAHSIASANRAIAARQVSPAQFSCLNALWMRESGWNHKARNPHSGAYGIPQAYPAHKMASAGSDWRTNPATQIRWGLKYIKQRYGTPCAAWNFWKANNWY